MMHALVVDNELNSREELAALLGEIPDLTVAGTCANAIQALHTIRTSHPELLFVDIHMPKVDGFQLVSMIEPESMPCVVFVTAHEQYALKAFEENAVDYLLKPVTAERLRRTVEKARRYLGEGGRPTYRTPDIERVPCVCAQGIKLVPVAEVELIHSSDTGVHLATTQGEFLTELTLALLESKVPGLVRCHKQYLVNLNHVDMIRRAEPGTAVLRTRSGNEVPVTRRYLAGLKERLGI